MYWVSQQVLESVKKFVKVCFYQFYYYKVIIPICCMILIFALKMVKIQNSEISDFHSISEREKIRENLFTF